MKDKVIQIATGVISTISDEGNGREGHTTFDPVLYALTLNGVIHKLMVHGWVTVTPPQLDDESSDANPDPYYSASPTSRL